MYQFRCSESRLVTDNRRIYQEGHKSPWLKFSVGFADGRYNSNVLGTVERRWPRLINVRVWKGSSEYEALSHLQ